MGTSPRRHLRSRRGVARAREAGAPAPAHISRYLAAFGPARAADIVSWSGIPPARAEAGAGAHGAAPFQKRSGRGPARPPTAPTAGPLGQGAGALPPHLGRDPARACPPQRHPPRALPSEVFSTKTPQSVPTFTVDGQVAGTWERRRAKCSSSRSSRCRRRPAARSTRRRRGWHSSSHERIARGALPARVRPLQRGRHRRDAGALPPRRGGVRGAAELRERHLLRTRRVPRAARALGRSWDEMRVEPGG